ncbi:hypothetical protein MNEG_2771, partial [Monoraphidium neglectum]
MQSLLRSPPRRPSPLRSSARIAARRAAAPAAAGVIDAAPLPWESAGNDPAGSPFDGGGQSFASPPSSVLLRRSSGRQPGAQPPLRQPPAANDAGTRAGSAAGELCSAPEIEPADSPRGSISLAAAAQVPTDLSELRARASQRRSARFDAPAEAEGATGRLEALLSTYLDQINDKFTAMQVQHDDVRAAVADLLRQSQAADTIFPSGPAFGPTPAEAAGRSPPARPPASPQQQHAPVHSAARQGTGQPPPPPPRGTGRVVPGLFGGCAAQQSSCSVPATPPASAAAADAAAAANAAAAAAEAGAAAVAAAVAQTSSGLGELPPPSLLAQTYLIQELYHRAIFEAQAAASQLVPAPGAAERVITLRRDLANRMRQLEAGQSVMTADDAVKIHTRLTGRAPTQPQQQLQQQPQQQPLQQQLHHLQQQVLQLLQQQQHPPSTPRRMSQQPPPPPRQPMLSPLAGLLGPGELCDINNSNIGQRCPSVAHLAASGLGGAEAFLGAAAPTLAGGLGAMQGYSRVAGGGLPDQDAIIQAGLAMGRTATTYIHDPPPANAQMVAAAAARGRTFSFETPPYIEDCALPGGGIEPRRTLDLYQDLSDPSRVSYRIRRPAARKSLAAMLREVPHLPAWASAFVPWTAQMCLLRFLDPTSALDCWELGTFFHRWYRIGVKYTEVGEWGQFLLLQQAALLAKANSSASWSAHDGFITLELAARYAAETAAAAITPRSAGTASGGGGAAGGGGGGR